MGYLLDSHVIIWALSASPRLSEKAKALLSSSAQLYISIAALWEIAIKHNAGRLVLPADFIARIASGNVIILPVGIEHIQALATLEDWHRDPFDRMMVAQAKVERLTLVTDDKMLAKYNIKTIAV